MREHFPFQEAHNAIVDMLHDYLAEKEHAERLETENSILMNETARLKAEVERLRKAGDAVCESPYLWENDPAVIAWNAAKEGKPSV